jgi:hypothetical protein
MRRLGRSLSTAVLLALLMPSCADFTADLQDAKKSQADIKGELGLDAQVDFRTLTGTKGKRLFVSVHLKGPPAGDVAVLKGKVSDIVTRDFHTHVDGVALTF